MATPDREFTRREIQAGLFVLASLAVLIAFVVAIRGCDTSEADDKHFTATFSNVSGLDVGAQVRFGGLKAGRVVAIEPDPDDQSLIRVDLQIGGGFPVNEGSRASIDQISLTSAMHLEVSTGEPGQPLLDPGAEIPIQAGAGWLDLPNVDGAIERLETLLDRIISLVGPEGAYDGGEAITLPTLLATLEETLEATSGTARALEGTITDSRPGVARVIEGLERIETSAQELLTQLNGLVEENRPAVRSATGNLDDLTRDLDAQVDEVAEAVKETLATYRAVGESANGLLAEDQESLRQILISLEATTRNLQDLSRTLADEPESLLRGKGRQGRPHREAP